MDGLKTPNCGSDCNERDELIKAERELEKLRREVNRLNTDLLRAKRAAFDECAKICEKVSEQLGDGTKFETAEERGAYECVLALQAAKKGTT